MTILPTLGNFILEIELEQTRVLVSHVFLSLPSSFLTPMVFPQHLHQRYSFLSQPLELKDDLSYEEEPIAIVAREIKVLRTKTTPLVKVLWKHHGSEEAT